MAPLSIATVIAAVVLASPLPSGSPSPSPQPALKTIVIVHSSQFCTALRESVLRPFAMIVHNDRSIELGRSEFAAAGDRIIHGGVEAPSDNLLGAPKLSPSSSDTFMVENRQRRLAATIEGNIEAIETTLSNKKGFAVVAAADEIAALSSFASQLIAIVVEQRTAVNLISGQVEGAELVNLYNREPSFGGADATHGVSPLEAMEAGYQYDERALYDVWQASQESSVPRYDPYAPFTRALVDDQHLIAESEDAASKSILQAARGCN